jgi:arylamine N-acetyltransferase
MTTFESTPANSPDGLLALDLRERVLEKLGFNTIPDATLECLHSIYGAWCQRVPFDNVRKVIHVQGGNAGPLPGNTPQDYFEAWLKYGTGGTCWSGAGSLCSLLVSIGFVAERGIGTMLVVPDVPPNHGTVLVTLGQDRYLVDCSMLFGEPLRLDEQSGTCIAHPAWSVRCSRRDGKWFVAWRPLHKVEGFECRIERFGATHPEYQNCYEQTRGWSPFNYEVTARSNREDRVIGVAFGKSVSLDNDGTVRQAPVSKSERNRILVDDIGISEEIVARLPDDKPTPPPPWSRTAQSAGTVLPS